MIDNLEPPFRYYKKVFVIFEGGTGHFCNARICLFDNQLTVIEEEGAMAVYNFDNIIGVSCYDRE